MAIWAVQPNARLSDPVPHPDPSLCRRHGPFRRPAHLLRSAAW